MKKGSYTTIMLVPHSEEQSVSIKIPNILIKIVSLLVIFIIFIAFNNAFDYVQLQKENKQLEIAKINDEQKINYYVNNYAVLFHDVQTFKDKIYEVEELENYIKVKNGFDDGTTSIEEINNGFILEKNNIMASAVSINQAKEDLSLIKEMVATKEDSLTDLMDQIDSQNEKLASIPSIWPSYGRITSGFGYRRDPFNGRTSYHSGIDLANRYGTPIYATADGIVTFSGWHGGYGYEVIINHQNGFVTYYGHNSRNIVKQWSSVKKGQLIAYIGSTGRSTGPHVDYRITKNGTYVNPLNYMK